MDLPCPMCFPNVHTCSRLLPNFVEVFSVPLRILRISFCGEKVVGKPHKIPNKLCSNCSLPVSQKFSNFHWRSEAWKPKFQKSTRSGFATKTTPEACGIHQRSIEPSMSKVHEVCMSQIQNDELDAFIL